MNHSRIFLISFKASSQSCLPIFLKKSVQKQFEHFSTTLSDKKQIRGLESQLYARKLAKFVSSSFQSGNVSEKVFDLCTALVETTPLLHALQSKDTKIYLKTLQTDIQV